MAVVDPDSGNIQAIVGGSDYDQSEVNLATGQGGGGRPCGSVFKTFTLVEAIKKKIDPTSTYVDCTSPATIDGYTLENYGNSSYGTRTVAGAFAISSNTGFVRLISSVGVEDVADTAHDLGVESDLHEDEAGATLTLGVQNVTPLELANAVATIANGGVRHDLCAVTTIESHGGDIIVDDSDPSKRARRVLTAEQAHAVQEVMKGVVTSGTGTAASLYNGQPVAGKTGTSEDYKDISFVGYTPFIAAAIWVGDPTNASAVPTGTAADVFRSYASAVIEREEIPVQDFDDADDPKFESYEDSKYHISNGYSYYYNYNYNYNYNYKNNSSSSSSSSASNNTKNKNSNSGSNASNDGGTGSGSKNSADTKEGQQKSESGSAAKTDSSDSGSKKADSKSDAKSDTKKKTSGS